MVCALIEIFLSLTDWRIIDIVRFRQTAYEFGGFWPGLLSGWQPNYAAQPYIMFVSYAFLHGGLVHLTVNMFTLFSLGRLVAMASGTRGLALIYGASALGGAVFYAMLSSSLQPMVGASGALFGLAGALLAWSFVDRIALGEGIWPVARVALLLVAINIVMWWALNGQLAWQTHLGGFVSGAITALLFLRPESLSDT